MASSNLGTEPSPIVSRVEYVAAALRAAIIDGRLCAGERLVIAQLAKQFGVSLIPVREALARLHAQRLLVFTPNHGYAVAAELTPDELEQLFEARLMIEVAATRFGVPNATAAEIARLHELNRGIADCRGDTTTTSYNAFITLNDEFHRLLVCTARNRFIEQAYDSLCYGPLITRGHRYPPGIPNLAEIVIEHERIIAALERGDVEATTAAVSAHIRDGMGRTQKRLGLQPDMAKAG